MYKNKKFGVFGLGISGISTMKYLREKKANFIAYDDNIQNIKNSHPEFIINLLDLSNPAWKEIDYLILSPGIPLTHPEPHPVVQIAKQNNIKIISDIELLYLDNPESCFIGITGTNGKSTTTALISHILKYNKFNAIIGGNIGTPVLDIKNDSKDAIYVIETSSYQLDLLDKTKFNIAILLNITPDHLDRHGNLDNYTKSKYRIFTHQTINDHAIINQSLNKEAYMTSFSEEEKADISIINNIIYIDKKQYDMPYNNSLIGKHNQQNMAASIACCLKLGLDIEQILSSIPSFIGLNHRMQYVGKHNDIIFINDSKATNAESTAKSLASFNNIIWIAGGYPKEGGIESLRPYFSKIKQALLIGKAQEEFSLTCADNLNWQKCDNLSNAFNIALSIAKKDDVILLSPACASFDQWKNFEQRGNAFIELFESLENNQ